jgi:uncharacterized protein YkwD
MRRLFASALLAVLALLMPLAAQVGLAATRPPSHAQFVQRVVELVNGERQRAGLPPLVVNAALTRAAQEYSGVLADGSCFAHNCGSTLTERLERAGYTERRAWAENIAAGQSSPEAVMTAWMVSSGHRGNVLSANYQEIGIGLAANGNGRLYWVQNFGRTVNGPQPAPAPTTPPTQEPSAPVECAPRPTFELRTSRTVAGVLEVTVAAGRGAGAESNTLKSIRFNALVNGTVDVTGRGRVSSGTTVTMAAGTQQATFVVRRVASGAATMVPLVLTDGCGEWSTFVGGGAGSF